MAINKNKVLFFHELEEKFWEEKVESNHYFASWALILLFLQALVTIGSTVISKTFDIYINISVEAFVYSAIILTGWVTIESILASANAKIATLRTLLFISMALLIIVAAAILSMIVIIVLVIFAAIFVLWIIAAILGGESGGKNGSKKWMLSDGTTVTESSGLLGEKYYRGNDGKEYERNSDGTFTPKC